jgi:hypothetical protein
MLGGCLRSTSSDEFDATDAITNGTTNLRAVQVWLSQEDS